MGFLAFDFRDALKSLRREPSYAATVVATLALTIGAATAVFSIVDGVLLKPLPYRESHRLVALREIWRELSDRIPTLETNERHVNYWREHATSFESMAQYRLIPANLTGAGEAAQIIVAHASGALFQVLQIQAAIGRALVPDDERPERLNVAVVADGLWRNRLGGDPNVVGRSMTIDGRPYTIVGVLPASFRLPEREQLSNRADVFVPLYVDVGWVGDHNDQAIGRLRAGISPQQARAELDVLQAQVSARATQEAHEPVTLTSVVTPLADAIVGKSRRGLLLLLAAIGGVLLIACSNVANLSLTRTLGRMRDAAVRSALGATRQRLIARAALEQMILAVVGGGLGVGIAWSALQVFVRTAPLDLPRVDEVALDGRVLFFAAAISAATGLLVAVAPASWIASRDIETALRTGGRTGTGDRAGARTRASLLAAQIALSVTLLIVTGLLGASLLRLLNVDRGFNANRVLAIDVALPASRYATEPLRQAAYDRLIESVRAVPGIESAATTSMLPLTGAGQVNGLVADGDLRPRSESPSANFRFVAPDYLKTLGITVTRGRSFTDSERDSARPAPALLSESAASRLWPGADPIGKRFSRGLEGEQGFEVVGVTADARTTFLDRVPPLMVYAPYWWRSRPAFALVVKTAGDPAAAMPTIRRVIAGIDPDIAIGRTRPLDELVEASTAGRRYQARLLLAFGAAALLIAAIGVYGVTAYGVSRRRREMNIRIALGAQMFQVQGMIVRQIGWALLAGAVVGLAGAIAAGRAVSSLLFDVGARDPWIFAGATLVVGAVGLTASMVAVRQGLSIDPTAALREE